MKVLECSVSKAQEALEGVIQDIPEPSWTSNLNDEGELPCLDGVEGCDEGETKVKFAEVEQGQKDNSCNSTEDDCNEANDQGIKILFYTQLSLYDSKFQKIESFSSWVAFIWLDK